MNSNYTIFYLFFPCFDLIPLCLISSLLQSHMYIKNNILSFNNTKLLDASAVKVDVRPIWSGAVSPRRTTHRASIKT